MKHADASTLEKLHDLLVELRKIHGMVERKPGIFYRRGAAYLHFHKDPAGRFADVKLDSPSFTRMPVNTRAQRDHLLKEVRRALG